jgi:hypothetical protein
VRPGVESSTRWGYPKKDKTTLRPANWPSMPFEPRTERYCHISLAEQSSTVMGVTYASDGMRRIRSNGTFQLVIISVDVSVGPARHCFWRELTRAC